jgi:hypothetical protein
VVHRLDLAGLDRQQLGLRSGVLDRLAWPLELDLLDAVGGKDRDRLALQFTCHLVPASGLTRAVIASIDPERQTDGRSESGWRSTRQQAPTNAAGTDRAASARRRAGLRDPRLSLIGAVGRRQAGAC